MGLPITWCQKWDLSKMEKYLATWCQKWDLSKMEKYLAPKPIREGDLNEQWKWFKREFEQFLVAVGKENRQSSLSFSASLDKG